MAALMMFTLLAGIERGHRTMIPHDPCPHFAGLALFVT
jgi:hypothetical protein